MNISITDSLVGYVRKKVKSGRYNSASEVVRDALRRMEDQESRDIRLAKPAAEDVIADLTEQQVESIRHRVRTSVEAVEHGEYVDYVGREGLKELAAGVKTRGRRLLAQETKKSSRE